MRIQNKLFLVFGLCSTLIVIFLIITTASFNSIEDTYSSLTKGPFERLTYISQALRELTSIRSYILTMGYHASDMDGIDFYYSKYLESADMFQKYLDDYGENLSADPLLTEADKVEYITTIAYINELFRMEYQQYLEGIYQAAIAGEQQAMIDLIINQGRPIGNAITDQLNQLREKTQDTVNLATLHARNTSTKTKLLLTISAFVVGSLALLLSFFMSRVIKAPILNMEFAAREISKGNLTYPIRSTYKDELGILSNNIGDMVDTISVLNQSMAVVESLDDMIIVTDLAYNIIYINRKALTIYDTEKNACLGKKCYNVFYDLDEPCSCCPSVHLIEDKENLPSCEWERLLPEKKIWLACRTSIIRWGDGSYVQVFTGKDDTMRVIQEEQRKQYEDELQKIALIAEDASRTKSVFLANMSHEIRTPMNSIIGFSELALDDNIPPKTRDYLGKIKDSSEGLLQIINDILDISKVEAGRFDLEEIPFHIHDVFHICQTLISPKASEKGISLYCYVEPSVGKMLIGDPTRLRQALLNLLSNAVKFTNTGMVKLLCTIEEKSEDSISMRFEVKDSGIGMAAAQIEKVFDPFMQADTSTVRKYGGTGLGLPITKNIIELMGGILKVESALGIGSKFSFVLTFQTIDIPTDTAATDASPTEVFKKPTFSGEVLVCEDNVLNQQVIREHLSRVGLNTTIAKNGKEGVEIVEAHIRKGMPFDLIFMDIHMPIMDGLDAAKLLQRIGNPSPIIALTANIMPNDKETYRTHGMFDYIAKPFTSQELWACLLKYLTPVETSITDEKEQEAADEKLKKRLKSNFIKDNQTTFQDMNAAIRAGDIKLAHRTAHTLKSSAGLIGKTDLQNAASAIERSLAQGTAAYTQEQMDLLEAELISALSELSAHDTIVSGKVEEPPKKVDKATALAALVKLENALSSGSSECLEMLDDLRAIQGTDELAEHIENYDFDLAMNALVGVKQTVEDYQ